nr:HypC/HybG/HupF family hydrogenase formation chaperone [Rhabdochromatium marinum]
MQRRLVRGLPYVQQQERAGVCLGIPMQIKELNGLVARCEAKGVEREANLLMLMHEELAVGDYLVVHLGRAIERVSAEDAATAWALYDEMLAAMDAGAPAPVINSSETSIERDE